MMPHLRPWYQPQQGPGLKGRLMAAKGPRTLFEAIQSSPRRTTRELKQPPVERGPAGQTDRGADERRGMGISPSVSRVTPRTVGVLALAVGVALVIVWVSHRGGDGSGGDESLPSIEQLAASSIAGDVLAGSGPADVRSVRPMVYDVGAVLPGDGGGTPLSEGTGTSESDPPAGVAGVGVDASVSGDWRIRICRSRASRKRDFDRAVAFLKAHGVETATELRSKYYFLDSRQTFPSRQHPLCLSLLKRIVELGGAFAEESGTNTDFHDAYALKRPSRN